MSNTTTLAELADSTSDINQLGVVGSSGEVTRDRFNQAASVEVTDAPDGSAIYTSRYHGDSWKRTGAQLGNDAHHQGTDVVIPLPSIGVS